MRVMAVNRPSLKRKGVRLSGIIQRTAIRMRVNFDRAAKSRRASTGYMMALGLLSRAGSRTFAGIFRLITFIFSLFKNIAIGIYYPLRSFFMSIGALCLMLADDFTDYRHKLSRKATSRIAPVCLMLIMTVFTFLGFTLNLGIEVTMNGVSMGFIGSKDEMSEIIHEAEVRASEYLGTHYSINPQLSYKIAPIDNSNLLDPSAVKNILFASIDNTESIYALTVDGAAIAYSSSNATLQNLLERVKLSKSTFDTDVKTDFVQDVRIEEMIAVSKPSSPSLSDVENLLTSNSRETQVYSIQKGDTISDIASEFDMRVSHISNLNPELNVDKISIGQEIVISAAVPYLSLRQTRTEEYEESIPFKTEVIEDDTMYVNQSKVTVNGVDGLAAVVANVVYVDARVSEKDVLSYDVLEEPVTEVKIVGTKPLPLKAATGTFKKPSSGVFTSGYGYRKNLGDNHTGVDFAGAVGTSIWAADGGTVTFAGWKGTYGNCVIIDHGNGYETLYAHCSKLLVSSGQKVAKGENIAQVGSTGRSTGPHVHFEIRLNGSLVNPLNYIGK